MAKHSYMPPDEVKRTILELYGRDPGGQRRLGDAMGKNEVTISRWCTNRAPVGDTEARFMRLLVEKHRTRNFTLTEEQLAELD